MAMMFTEPIHKWWVGNPIHVHLQLKANRYVAMVQNQWYHFGVGAPPILVSFSGDWDVHWGYDLGFDPWPCA